MRTYDKEQQDSVMFEGSQAREIIDLRRSMDSEAESICQELHAAFDRAEERFKELSLQYEPRIQSYLKGTELEGISIDMVGFDFSNSEKHGVVFAKKVQRSPLEAFLNLLRITTDEVSASPGSDDRIYVEPIDKDSTAKQWGVRERENA
jgi:hypothetical protein